MTIYWDVVGKYAESHGKLILTCPFFFLSGVALEWFIYLNRGRVVFRVRSVSVFVKLYLSSFYLGVPRPKRLPVRAPAKTPKSRILYDAQDDPSYSAFVILTAAFKDQCVWSKHQVLSKHRTMAAMFGSLKGADLQRIWPLRGAWAIAPNTSKK
jgi:hypothetical protein